MKPPNLATKPNPQINPRFGQGRAALRRETKTAVQIQPQVQTREVNEIKEQTLPKQKEGIQTPLNKPTTERFIEQLPKTCIMPEHTIRPKMNAEQVPFYKDPLVKPPPRLPDIKKTG